MPYDGNDTCLRHDLKVLETIKTYVAKLNEGLARSGVILSTIRRWLAGQRGPTGDVETFECVMGMACDLELFTPSMTGRTAIDRLLASRRPLTEEEREAFDALAGARFRLVTILGRDGPGLARVKDLLTEEVLVLLDSRISPRAAGVRAAMRLCPLASGRQALISPLFAIDETLLASAMTFTRQGRLPGGGHRCAQSLYRDAARAGLTLIPTISMRERDAAAGNDPAVEARVSAVQRLATRWLDAGSADDAELVAETRRAANLDNLVDACGLYGKAMADGPEPLRRVLARIIDIQLETLGRRGRAGVGGHDDILDRAAARIAREVAAGRMDAAAGEIFERLRRRSGDTHGEGRKAGGHKTAEGPDPAELDRVIQRIQALRAKTVDRGCTEQEAMAAAEKVAQLLARHDLSLDEIGVRKSECAGVAVETGRRRRGAIVYCVEPVAAFCDCRVWSEAGEDGALRYIYFGLKADVEAARFLHTLIEDVFETESDAFRRGDLYAGLYGGARRTALNSFQIGLANGIGEKLNTIKAARSARAATSTGFDLVAVKEDVVEDELDRLGLHFTRNSRSSNRRIHGEAYRAGQSAGALFEPHAALGG